MNDVKNSDADMPCEERKPMEKATILYRWANDPNPIGVLDTESGEVDRTYPLQVNSIREDEREAYLDQRFGPLTSTTPQEEGKGNGR